MRLTDLGESAEKSSRFYRLKASYVTAGENVDFNIVVGCSVTVTRHGDNSTSYDAFRDPVVFAKPTKGGGAIMQLSPNICNGATTANGRIPQDFLPGAVLFDNRNDLSFGVGYLSEDAFESPKSKLKFLGATVEAASEKEWMEFQPIAAENLVDPSRFFMTPQALPSKAEIASHLWNREFLNDVFLGSLACKGIARFKIDRDPKVLARIRNIWPQENPQFWRSRGTSSNELSPLLSDPAQSISSNGVSITQYFHKQMGLVGFPTRAGGGGEANAQHHHLIPSPIFPVKSTDGIPWAGPELADPTHPIVRDLEIDGGRNLGLTYCYPRIFGYGDVGEMHIPGIMNRTVELRIDGMPALKSATGEGGVSFPPVFFERDEYIYLPLGFTFE